MPDLEPIARRITSALHLHIDVHDPATDEVRRRRLLDLVLFVAFAMTVLIAAAMGIATYLGAAGSRQEIGRACLGIAGALIGMAGVYVLNRFVASWIPATLFLLTIVAVNAIADEPWQVVNGRSVVVFAIPILAASVLLRPWASYLLTGASTIAVLAVGTLVPGHLPNIPVIASFFVLALLSHVSTTYMEAALREARSANLKLLESQETLRLIYESAFDGISVYEELPETRSRRLIDCNERYAEMAGQSREELLRIGNPNKIMRNLGPVRTREENERIRREKLRYNGLISWIRPDGKENIIEYSASPIEIHGRPLTVGIDRDITERVRIEAALREYSERLEDMVSARTAELERAQAELLRREKLSILGQLAGGIGHDLRSPLNVIKNAAYLLRGLLHEPEGQVADMLNIVSDEVDNANRIIHDLLDFARTREPALQPTDLNQVADAVLSHVDVPPPVEVVRNWHQALPLIQADPGQLSQTLTNLIQNAVQAMPDGGRLEVRTGIADPDASRVYVAVQDTGVGIAEQDLPRIFEPLFSTRPTGIGLGLALCRMLVKAHKGTIEVSSTPGQGSTFTVFLPCAESTSSTDDSTPPSA